MSIDRLAGMPPAGSRFRHGKGGIYMVIGVAIHTEDNEPLVVYAHEDHPNMLWARPADMFTDGRFEEIQ